MNEIEIVVTGKSDGFDKIEKDAKQAGDKIGRGLEKGLDDAKKAGNDTAKSIRQDLDKTAENAKEAGKQIGTGLTDGISGALDSGSIDAGGTLTNMLGGLGPVGVAGGLIGGALLGGITAEWKEDALGGMIAAQTGQASSEAERLGDVAGSIFANNFGESMEDVAAAMTAVLQTGLVDTGATDEVLQDITEKVITAGEIIGEETKNIARAANQLLVNDLAGSSSEAIDIITHAGTEGLNVADDLLDTITEYSGQFSRLGLSGEQSMGLISQAMAGGARDTDYAADALKEFAIRAQDGSESTARGFRTIGLDAGKMGDAIARGGSSARTALDATLDGLRAIEDPVLRNQAAVDLFGTKAEDLGDALYDMDLDTAAKDFGDYEDAAKKAADTTAENASMWDKLGRGIGTVVSGIGEATEGFLEWAHGDFSWADTAKKSTDAYLGSIGQLAPEQEKLLGAMGSGTEVTGFFAGTLGDASAEGMGLVETLEELIAKQEELASGVLNLSEAQMGWHEAIDNVAASLEENGRTLDITTEKGRNNQSTLNDLAAASHDVAVAMEDQGASATDVQKHMERSREEFIRSARQLGATGREAERAADKLGLTGSAARKIPKNVHTSVGAATSAALGSIGRVGSALRSLDGSSATVRVSAIGSALGLRHGGIVGGGLGFAHGGIVGGDGAVPWGAQSGGQRHSSTIINEAGPEMVQLPSGSRVATAGATRALAESGAFGGGGGGGSVAVQLVAGAGADSMTGQFLQQLVRKGIIRLKVDDTGRVRVG